MAKYCGLKNLEQWLCAGITIYPNFNTTRPVLEVTNESFEVTFERIAPLDGPQIIEDKFKARFFSPCPLKSADLIGTTLEIAKAKGQPLVGKQRSGSHVTTSNLAVLDIDGVPAKSIRAALKQLIDEQITYGSYSSHSHGRADKPCVRMRIIIPIDRPVNAYDYRRICKALTLLFFRGLADESGYSLAQQQGVWATSESRKHLAFRRMHLALIASTDKLLTLVPSEQPKARIRSNAPIAFDASRVSEAIDWIDLSEYSNWFHVGLWLKAAHGDDARQLWIARSDHDGKYDPTEFWDDLDPRMPPEAGAGCLFRAARDQVVHIINQCAETGEWAGTGMKALTYLKCYHPRKYAELFGEVA